MATGNYVGKATTSISSDLEKGSGRTITTRRYDETASVYDQITQIGGYKGPSKMATTMATLFPGTRDNIRVLDVAAGTGLAGIEMSKVGFTKIDAVDPSQGMLDKARERNVYGRLICDYVDDQHQLDVPDSGVIVNVTRSKVFTGMEDYIDVLGPHFRKLEDSGKWEEESRTTFTNYLDGIDGIAIVDRIP